MFLFCFKFHKFLILDNFVKVFWFFFDVVHFWISREHFRQRCPPPPPPLCSLLALIPLWLCDWELSITCWWTGSVLKKVHVGQKEMAGVWQASSMEGGKAISHRLVGPLLLVKPEPPCYCSGCVRDIPRALFWLLGPWDCLLQAKGRAASQQWRTARANTAEKRGRKNCSHGVFRNKSLIWLLHKLVL